MDGVITDDEGYFEDAESDDDLDSDPLVHQIFTSFDGNFNSQFWSP